MSTTGTIYFPYLGSHYDVAIISHSDSGPETLGWEILRACEKIIWSASPATPPMLALKGLSDIRACTERGLSAMVLGLIHQVWDAPQMLQVDGESSNTESTCLQTRYSHNQFSLLPASNICSDFAKFVYEIKFMDCEPYGVMAAQKRLWIEFVGQKSFKGWTEQFKGWLEQNHPERTSSEP